jgi:transposase
VEVKRKMDREELDGLLSWGWTLEQIGRHFGTHASTVSYWVKKYGLSAVNTERHRARGGIERAVLEQLVERGLSITELAAELDRSKATVRHWLRRHDLQTLQGARRAQHRAAVSGALAVGAEPPRKLAMQCRVHGETTFVREGSGYYRCGKCRSESVVRHRRKLKDILLVEAGGRCAICGYDRDPRALEFHHLDPREKDFALSRRGVTRSLTALRAEAKKCVLLCSNCHAEVESGAVSLPVQ